MALYQTNAGDRILAADINQYYNILKGVAASGEAVTLIYNNAGVLAIVPSSDPAASTQFLQIKNAATTVKSALTAGGGAVFSSQVNFAKGSDIASSGTTDLSTITGNYAQVSGTTTITAFGTVQAGTIMVLEFQGILTLTHNATSLILRSGASATTAAGDIYIFVSEGSGNWREISHLTTSTTLADSDPTLQTSYHHIDYEWVNGPTPPNVVNVGTGATTAGAHRGISMLTGVTNPSSTSIRSFTEPQGTTSPGGVISKVRRLEIAAQMADVLANSNSYVYFTEESVDTAPSGTARHFGIKNLNGTVSFTTADGATEQTTAITTWITGGVNAIVVITFDGTTAKCYIDGTLRATHSTNVPAGGTVAILRAFINNNSTANSRLLYVNAVHVLMAN